MGTRKDTNIALCSAVFAQMLPLPPAHSVTMARTAGPRLEVDALERGPDVVVLVLVVGVHVAADGPAEQDGLLRDGCDAPAHILRTGFLAPLSTT